MIFSPDRKLPHKIIPIFYSTSLISCDYDSAITHFLPISYSIIYQIWWISSYIPKYYHIYLFHHTSYHAILQQYRKNSGSIIFTKNTKFQKNHHIPEIIKITKIQKIIKMRNFTISTITGKIAKYQEIRKSGKNQENGKNKKNRKSVEMGKMGRSGKKLIFGIYGKKAKNGQNGENAKKWPILGNTPILVFLAITTYEHSGNAPH